MGYSWILLLFTLLLKLSQLRPLGALSEWLLSPPSEPIIVFWSTSLLVGTTRCSSLILYLPCFRLAVNHFPSELWFIYWRTVFQNQDLSARCAHCSWGVMGMWPSKWPELRNIFMYTNPCVHTYLYLFLQMYLYFKTMSSYWYLTVKELNTTGLILTFFLSLLVTFFFFSSEKPVSVI